MWRRQRGTCDPHVSLRMGGGGAHSLTSGPQPVRTGVGLALGWLAFRAGIGPLYQVKIQPFAHDPNVPALEALIGVPVPQSEGPITHTWAVQMVSATQRRACPGLWGRVREGADAGQGGRREEACPARGRLTLPRARRGEQDAQVGRVARTARVLSALD